MSFDRRRGLLARFGERKSDEGAFCELALILISSAVTSFLNPLELSCSDGGGIVVIMDR